jgi:hypothetical protein
MNFATFAALLLNRAIFFSRLDRAEDPWDGVFPRRSCDPDEVAAYFSQLEVPQEFFREIAQAAAGHATDPDSGRVSYCVNCWHINRFESDAMWKTYSLVGQGIAIRSTVGRLKRSFASAARPVFIGRVSYYDYGRILINPFQVFPVVLCKRKSFQHERELRCILYDSALGFKSEFGEHVPVDLKALVNKVVLSPRSEPWLFDVACKLIAQCGLKLVVERSSHLAGPQIPIQPSEPNDSNPGTEM